MNTDYIFVIKFVFLRRDFVFFLFQFQEKKIKKKIKKKNQANFFEKNTRKERKQGFLSKN